MFLRLPLAALACALACTGPLSLSARSQPPQPEVQAAEIVVRALGTRAAELRLRLRADNPGPAVQLEEALLEWTLDDLRFASSRHALDAEWPAQAAAQQEIDVSLAYLAFPPAERPGARRADSFQLAVQGTLRARAGERQLSIPLGGAVTVSRPTTER